jgi:hypothetical protein
MLNRSRASADAYCLPLFAIARDGDPSTSTEAAKSVSPKLAGLRLEFISGLAACGGSATANEVARAISDNHSHRESIRKRAGECKRLGMIAEIGSRVCKVTGNRATVYAVVDR